MWVEVLGHALRVQSRGLRLRPFEVPDIQYNDLSFPLSDCVCGLSTLDLGYTFHLIFVFHFISSFFFVFEKVGFF